MIYVDISTRCPQKSRVEEFAEKVINSFFTKRFSRSVWIDIQVGKVEEGYLGFCYGDSEFVQIELARRDTEGNMLSSKDIAHNLAHELVHAKQFIKRQIDGNQRYRKTATSEWEDHSNTKYKDQPWEIEAYELEEELLERFWK